MSTFIGIGANKKVDENTKIIASLKKQVEELTNLNASLIEEKETLELKVKESTEKTNKKNKSE